MSQIFISHSKEDKDLINFFSKVFSSTKVKAIWEEFEKIITLNSVTSKKIKDDFASLSKNKKELKENIIDYISGRIHLDFHKDGKSNNTPKNYLDELKNIKDKF